MRFDQLSLLPEVALASAKIGWDRPTHLQTRAIPSILAGRDVAVHLPTGAGKTAAYLLPLFDRMLRTSRSGPRALVLASTEEQALRVWSQAEKLGDALGVACSSWLAAEPSEAALSVGTFRDLKRAAEMAPSLEAIVLDLGGRAKGSAEPIDAGALSRALPDSCQRALFCNGRGALEEGLSEALLRDPLLLPSPEGEHLLYRPPSSAKLALLLRLLKTGELPPALVLARSRNRADRIFRHLNRRGIKGIRIFGRAGRSQRERFLQFLSEERVRFLVTSEPEAQEFSPFACPALIQFDLPSSTAAYLGAFLGACHGPEGKTAFFATPDETAQAEELFAALGIAPSLIPLPDASLLAELSSSQKEDEEGMGEEAGERPGQPSSKRRRKPRGQKPRPGHQGKRASQGVPPEAGSVPSQPARSGKPAPSAPSRPPDEDEGDDTQPDDIQPLFPGQRTHRWNAFRLSLEQVRDPDAGGQREEQGRDQASLGAGKKGRKRKKGQRGGPPQRGSEISHAPKGDGAPDEADDDRQPEGNGSSTGGRPHGGVQQARARRFNSSARYSSLAGAPPPPKDEG